MWAHSRCRTRPGAQKVPGLVHFAGAGGCFRVARTGPEGAGSGAGRGRAGGCRKREVSPAELGVAVPLRTGWHGGRVMLGRIFGEQVRGEVCELADAALEKAAYDRAGLYCLRNSIRVS